MTQFLKFVLATITGFFLFSIFSIILLFAGISFLLPSSESVKQNSVLYLRLEGDLVERSEEDLFSLLFQNEDPVLGLDNILSAIKLAKNNPDIKGIYLKPGMLSAGYPSLNEIRKALIDFRTSGKFVIAYSGYYTQGAYFLSSAADTLYLNKEGILDFRGIATSSLFFKNLLEKVGVEMQVVKVGTYKSFTEQYTNTEMSQANKEQITLLVNMVWNNILQNISQARNIPKDSLVSAANAFLTFQSPEKILQMQMVDKLVYQDEVESVLRYYLGIKSETDINYVKPLDLIEQSTLTSIENTKDKIAVVYAVGEIDNGNTNGIKSSKISATLQKLKKDTTIKAVVLRVNSPGGSAYGAEQIWRAVSLLKDSKPVIVSMGDYAASGGYYISCNATKIVADPNTLTGSIGIFGVIPNIEDLMQKVGVGYDVLKTNEFSDMPNIYRKMSQDEKNIMQQYVNRGYDLFLKRCAEGRKLSVDSIAKIAEGRVWTGTSALNLGLVDVLGTLSDAVRFASEEANITSYTIKEYPKKKDLFSQLMEIPQLGMDKLFFNKIFTEKKAVIDKISHIDNLQVGLPFNIELH